MWLPIDDTYSVSLDGQVRKGSRILKGALDTVGYKQVCQYSKLKMLHRLVASRFLPAPTEEDCEIDHIDRDKSNNHASNLRWVCKSANMMNRTHTVPKITGQQYITLWPLKSGGIRYVVRFQRQGHPKYQKYHKTMEEAIVDRDKYLASCTV